MTTQDRPSLLELGRRRGAELAAEHPLSPELFERLAEMIRPALLHASDRGAQPGLTCARTGTARGPACLAGLGSACPCTVFP